VIHVPMTRYLSKLEPLSLFSLVFRTRLYRTGSAPDRKESGVRSGAGLRLSPALTERKAHYEPVMFRGFNYALQSQTCHLLLHLPEAQRASLRFCSMTFRENHCLVRIFLLQLHLSRRKAVGWK